MPDTEAKDVLSREEIGELKLFITAHRALAGNRVNDILYSHEALRAQLAAALEAQHALSNLLAVIHGDGGHHQSEHGTVKSGKDAEAKYIAKLNALDDALEAQQKAERRLASAREDLRVEISTRETAQCERDEARATIQRLTTERDEAVRVMDDATRQNAAQVDRLVAEIHNQEKLIHRFNCAFDRWCCGSEFYNDPERIAARMAEMVNGKIAVIRENQRLESEKREMREALKRIGKRTCVGNCDQGNTCSVCIARAALSGSPAAEGTKEARNSEALASFTEYCRLNPSQRFWQALRNWSRWEYILGAQTRDGVTIDTFNLEGLDGTRTALPEAAGEAKEG